MRESKQQGRIPGVSGRRYPSLADFRSTDADKRRELTALEAYYAAERRGFEGDGEVEDWLYAERTSGRTSSGRRRP